MSDYFAALMRASNLFASGATPSPEAPLEFGVEAPAAPLPAAPALRPLRTEPRAAVIASEQPTPAAQVSQPVPARQRHDAIHPASSAIPALVAPGPRAEPATRSPAAPQSRQPGVELPDGGPPRSPQAGERVQAAMRWVASDPQLTPPVQPAPTPRRAMAENPDRGQTPFAAIPPEASAPLEPPRPPLARNEASAPLPTPVAIPIQATEPARRYAEPEAQVAAAEEQLEISIGAIHLRVEAPAPRTLARTATPATPAQQPAASASPTRSGLSRRALRRL
ncbi:hypothetical protein E8F11_04855 [Pseudomonas sp. BN417]|uniref:hypothetical protein n=1 Tax=Pseudomonas sp. BN417 TaxID=2567890 RepID=UPI00245859D5|nr:hypothetical protein [Pseudomonas sp. BN417]MDH4554516.1 hypothetical protein [Pseudomonas sp. BN417]